MADRHQARRWSAKARDLGMAISGMTVIATPLALWAAWSETVFLVVLAGGAAAAVVYCLLARFDEPEPLRRPRHGPPIIKPPHADWDALHHHPKVRRRRASYVDDVLRLLRGATLTTTDMIVLAAGLAWLAVRL